MKKLNSVAETREMLETHPLFSRDTDWSRGVKVYAEKMLKDLLDRRRITDESTKVEHTSRQELLDGASSWYEFSRDGRALTEDRAIRDLLSPTSDVKRKYEGPMFWLDTQAEALQRAARIVCFAVNNRPQRRFRNGA